MTTMKISIHDNANGLDYTLVNDHYPAEPDHSSHGRAPHRAVGSPT